MNAAANARLALLALSVVLFAAVWSGDHQHRREAAAVRSAVAAGSTVSVRADSADSPPAAVRAPGQGIHADDVPLPAALEPRVYRIVATGGAVRTARFTADDLLYLGVAIAPESADVPMTGDGLQRWYFIRLDEGPRSDSDLAATTAPRADSPLCRATKLILAWAGESGDRDVRLFAGQCEDYMAGAARQWQELARTAADDLKQALGRVHRPAEISTRPRADQRL